MVEIDSKYMIVKI